MKTADETSVGNIKLKVVVTFKMLTDMFKKFFLFHLSSHCLVKSRQFPRGRQSSAEACHMEDFL